MCFGVVDQTETRRTCRLFRWRAPDRLDIVYKIRSIENVSKVYYRYCGLIFPKNIDHLSASSGIGDRHTVCVLNELNLFSWWKCPIVWTRNSHSYVPIKAEVKTRARSITDHQQNESPKGLHPEPDKQLSVRERGRPFNQLKPAQYGLYCNLLSIVCLSAVSMKSRLSFEVNSVFSTLAIVLPEETYA